DNELTELRDFLEAQKKQHDGLNIEEAHGYITGLICGPEVVHPSIWIPDVFNGPVEFESDEHEDRIIGLLCRLYNNTAQFVHAGEVFPEFYYPAHPVRVETSVDFKAIQDWTGAFIMAVADEDWVEISDFQMITFPIIVSNAEDDDETMKEICAGQESTVPEVRRHFLQYITPSVFQLYHYFAQVKHHADISMLQEDDGDGEEGNACHDENCSTVH
nr:UPF0149 family protein [Pseudomonadota bacterium]